MNDLQCDEMTNAIHHLSSSINMDGDDCYK